MHEVHQAYDKVRRRQLGSAVFISDLATELQIGLPKLHEWIRSEVIESGHGSLDKGHWPTATDHIIHEGRKKLFDRKGCEAMKVGIIDAIQAKGAPHDHLLGEPH